MKNLLIAMVILGALSITSCRIQAPVFKGVEHVELERVGLKGVKFHSEAVFYNPNKLKCQLDDIAMDVLLDKKNVGTIGEKSAVPIGKQCDFRIPLGVMLNPEGTIFENMMTIIEIFRDKESLLTLQGVVKVKAFGITVPVPVKYEQKVRLSQVKTM